ncbi:MAG: TIGR03086 family metal-binding protein [Acidimicrobiales bacterium]
MEQAAALESALANTTRLVQGIDADQWDQATPCAKWNVRELVTHTAGVMANFTNGAAGKPPVGDPLEYDLGADPGATMAELSATNVAAWRNRGELESVISLGENEFPGMVGISINMLDAYVHGWDIAQATGQQAMLDADLCAGLLEFSRQAVPEAPREGDNFHPVVATGDGASAQDQLLAYLGRQPCSAPPATPTPADGRREADRRRRLRAELLTSRYSSGQR